MYKQIELSKCKDNGNFITIPRSKDGALINGSYNRVWLLDKKIGTLNTMNSFFVGRIQGKYLKYRRLTSMEMWLLMGFSPTDYSKASAVCSDNQLIKQAGNSIHIPTVERVLKKWI